jgi:plastocyanin
MRAVCTAALLGVAVGAVGAQDYGTLEGQFVVDGKVPAQKPLVAKGDPAAKDPTVCAKEGVPDDSVVVNADNGGIANIVVYMRKAPANIHPDLKAVPADKAVFDQLLCRFTPHVLVVRVGQAVQCKSSDEANHNVHTYPFSNNAENFIISANDQVGRDLNLKLAESRPMKVGCDIHSYMNAWWVVLDHPYAAVTDADGKFKLENVPAGKHEFIVWHERAGYVNKKWEVTVKKGDNVQAPVKVKAADLLKAQ